MYPKMSSIPEHSEPSSSSRGFGGWRDQLKSGESSSSSASGSGSEEEDEDSESDWEKEISNRGEVFYVAPLDAIR